MFRQKSCRHIIDSLELSCKDDQSVKSKTILSAKLVVYEKGVDNFA